MRILLLCSAFNGMSQRVHRELELLGCQVSVQLATSSADMQLAVKRFRPQLIICPYLLCKIPAEIWQRVPCLIVHPGIEGDRGPSSLDWAIANNLSEWGVTLLQANDDMDAGDIWGTANFSLRGTSKASLYRREVTASAVALIKRALRSLKDPAFVPRPLNPGSAPGRLQPAMTQAERAINWARDTTDNIIAKLRAADSAPGVREEIAGHSVYLYGVAREPELRGKAGSFIAHSNGAICRATSDGAVWIRQAKHQGGIKLPAAQILLPLLKPVQKKAPRELRQIPPAAEDIRSESVGHVAYLHFDFAGGAMSTGQCLRLLEAYSELRASDARIIVLMGGEDFWSNGIHLNCIEAAQDPAQESQSNINAIDDLVEAIIRTPNQITVAAMRNNAGAGGAIMALACDHVILREGIVLNPHYRSMGLYGSEYWTYLLPRRVGRRQAQTLTGNCLPLLATEALQIGFADEIFDENWAVFQRELEQYCQLLSQSADFGLQLEAKRAMRAADEKNKPLQLYRDEELQEMSAVFFDPNADYHRARRDFVYKLPASKTPVRLQKNVRFWHRGVFS